MSQNKNSYKQLPNEKGYFGQFGGRYVSETLMPLIEEVETEYNQVKYNEKFLNELDYYLKNYVGRPSPLLFAERITNNLKGPKIYFKRDELNHTGAHKINNCMGQILLAKRMGKKRIIAETGAGQHGVATATVCALFGLPCVIYRFTVSSWKFTDSKLVDYQLGIVGVPMSMLVALRINLAQSTVEVATYVLASVGFEDEARAWMFPHKLTRVNDVVVYDYKYAID